jgi:alpha-mannosidase
MDLVTTGIANLSFGEDRQPLIDETCLTTHADTSDTWSHGLDRYVEAPSSVFESGSDWVQVEHGPLRWRWVNRFACDRSACCWTVDLFGDDRRMQMHIAVDWAGVQQVLKLGLRPGFAVTSRIDGVAGGDLAREVDGRELPFQGHLHVAGQSTGLTIVTDDVYAAGVQANGTVRLTLLRSPYAAHHDPYIADAPGCRFDVTDQGTHHYRLVLIPGGIDRARTDRELTRMTAAMCCGETTLGARR